LQDQGGSVEGMTGRETQSGNGALGGAVRAIQPAEWVKTGKRRMGTFGQQETDGGGGGSIWPLEWPHEEGGGICQWASGQWKSKAS